MSQTAEIELSIEEAQKLVDRRDAALKLSTNREFRKLILDGYFKDEAVRLVSLSSDPLMKQNRDDIIMDIQAIGALQRYLQNIVRIGNVAETELAEHRELLADAHAEAE